MKVLSYLLLTMMLLISSSSFAQEEQKQEGGLFGGPPPGSHQVTFAVTGGFYIADEFVFNDKNGVVLDGMVIFENSISRYLSFTASISLGGGLGGEDILPGFHEGLSGIDMESDVGIRVHFLKVLYFGVGIGASFAYMNYRGNSNEDVSLPGIYVFGELGFQIPLFKNFFLDVGSRFRGEFVWVDEFISGAGYIEDMYSRFRIDLFGGFTFRF